MLRLRRTSIFSELVGIGLVLLSLSLSLTSCKHAPADVSQSLDTAQRPEPVLGDLEELIEGGLPLACGYLMSAPEAACRSSVIEAVCAQGKMSLTEAIQSLRGGDNILPLSNNPEAVKALDLAIAKDFFESLLRGDEAKSTENFKLAVDRCMNHQHHEDAEKYAEEAKTPAFQKRVAAARRAFWTGLATSVVTSIGQETVMQTVSAAIYSKAAPNTFMSLKSLFALGMCSAAANFAASMIETAAVDYNQDQCQHLKEDDNRQLSACLRLSGSVCEAAMGTIDIRNLGLVSEDQALNILTDTVNYGGWMACQAGGPVSRTFCGVFNGLANQFHQTAKTGTNDIAECYQTTKLGRCLGQMWGSGGWTNNQGVEKTRRVTDKKGEKWWVRTCCLCAKDHYTKQWFKAPSYISTEMTMSVIQSGDFESGNCGAQSGKTVYNPHDSSEYWTYGKCRTIDVLGSSCSLEEGDRTGKRIPVKRLEWDSEKRTLSGRVISKEEGLDWVDQ